MGSASALFGSSAKWVVRWAPLLWISDWSPFTFMVEAFWTTRMDEGRLRSAPGDIGLCVGFPELLVTTGPVGGVTEWTVDERFTLVTQ